MPLQERLFPLHSQVSWNSEMFTEAKLCWPGRKHGWPKIYLQNFLGNKCWIWLQFSSVQSLSHVWLFVTPWTTAHQASLSITNSRSLPKLMFIKLVMPSSRLILCHPLLLLPSILPSIRVFSNKSTLRMRWPKYCSFSFSIIHSFQRIPRTDL